MTVRSAAAIAMCIAGLSAVTTTQAAQLDLRADEICALADTVVLGEVTDIETVWVPGAEGKIERRAFVSLDKALRGEASPSVEVIIPGGQIGAQWHWVEDTADLDVDSTYVLLLSKVAGTSSYHVLGGERGALRVARDGLGKGRHLSEIRDILGVCLDK